MELGANQRSVATLGGLLAVLAGVVYFQFFSGPPAPGGATPRPTPVRTTSAAGAGTEQQTGRSSAGRMAQGRFRPRLGGTSDREPIDPMTADTSLRTDLRDRLREVESPEVGRDIFSFGAARRPPPEPLTTEEVESAQARLEEEATDTSAVETEPPPEPPPPPAEPPPWTYYGLANNLSNPAGQAFLLDGEEILLAQQGMVLQDRYLVQSIGADAIEVQDLQAGQSFTIRLVAQQ